MGRSRMQGKYSLNFPTVLNTYFFSLYVYGLMLLCGIWFSVISNEVPKLLWMVSWCFNCRIQNIFGVRLFQISRSITVFILLKIMKVYFAEAVARVYIFDSSFQSQLEVFWMIKHIMVTTNSILQKRNHMVGRLFGKKKARDCGERKRKISNS